MLKDDYHHNENDLGGWLKDDDQDHYSLEGSLKDGDHNNEHGLAELLNLHSKSDSWVVAGEDVFLLPSKSFLEKVLKNITTINHNDEHGLACLLKDDNHETSRDNGDG